jgi:DNA-binding NarL/FixJ family response regulator
MSFFLNGPLGKDNSLARLVVVDDFAPFREVICSKLRQEPGLQIIAEVSDGLPALNGIAAARQIRELVPHSKIIFVTQESSPAVVQEALNLGAQGYVAKTSAADDLLPAIEAVLQGRQFVSSGLIAGSLG